MLERIKEVIAKLDYPAPKCHNCQEQMAKYDFQKESKIPYLECAGYKTLIRLRASIYTDIMRFIMEIFMDLFSQIEFLPNFSCNQFLIIICCTTT